MHATTMDQAIQETINEAATQIVYWARNGRKIEEAKDLVWAHSCLGKASRAKAEAIAEAKLEN